MRKIFRFFLSTVVCFTLISVLVHEGAAQVVLNEFLADPARDWDGDGLANFRDDEWVEIMNAGDAAVDITGYLLADGVGEPVWRYAFSGFLQPGETFVVFGSESRAWEEANGFPMYGLSLNNSGDRVALYRIAAQETLLVDSFEYGDREADDDRSVGRLVEVHGQWAVFDAYNPCSGRCDPPGNGCLPTPGSGNSCLTGISCESWGTIKSVYR